MTPPFDLGHSKLLDAGLEVSRRSDPARYFLENFGDHFVIPELGPFGRQIGKFVTRGTYSLPCI